MVRRMYENIRLSPPPGALFRQKMFLHLLHYIQVYFRLDFILKVNTINPDQTALREQSDLGP